MPDSDAPQPEVAPTSGDASVWRRMGAYTAARAVRWTVDVVVLAGLLWLVASQGLGMRTLLPWALERLAPEGWSVRAARADGDWTSVIRLTDVSARGPGIRVSAAEVSVRYALLPLLHRDIRLSHVRIAEPQADVRVARTSSDTEGSAAPAEASAGEHAAPDNAIERLAAGPFPGGWTLWVDNVDVSQGDVHAELPNGTYHADDVALRGRAQWVDAGLDATLDSLVLDVVVRTKRPEVAAHDGPERIEKNPVGKPRPLVGRLALAGSIADGILELDGLSFDSNNGRVRGGGRVALQPDESDEGRTDLQLHGEELDIRYAPFPVPSVLLQLPKLRLDARLLRAHDSTLVAEATVEARSADRAPEPALLSARIHATLDGWAADDLVRANASITRIPPSSRDTPGTLEGPLRLDASLDSDGRRRSGVLAGMSADATLQVGTRPPAGDTVRWRHWGDVQAELEGDSARWRVSARLDSASVDGAGTVDWSRESTNVSVERLTADGLDLEALWDAWPRTSINGGLDGRMVLASIDSLRGRLGLALGPSSLGTATLDTLAVEVRMDPGTFRGRAHAVRDSMRLGLVYEAELGDSVLRARAPEVSLTSTVTSDSTRAALEALGSAAIRWRLGKSRRGSATLTLDSARAAGVRVGRADIEATIDGEAVVGTARGHVLDALPTPVAVQASLDTHGFDPATLSGTVDFAAHPEADTTGSTPVDSVGATVTARGDGRFDLTGLVSPSAGGRIRLSGRAVNDEGSWALEASAAGRVGTGDTSAVSVDSLDLLASARRYAGGWRDGTLDLRSTGIRWRRIVADTLLAHLVLDSSALSLDTLRVLSNVADLTGSGALRRASADTGQIRIFGRILDPAPLLPPEDTGSVTIGSTDLEATLSGSPDSLELQSSLSAGAFVYRTWKASGADASLSASVTAPLSPDRRVGDAALDIGIDRLALPDAEVRSIDVGAEGGPDSLRLDASALVDDQRRGTLHARVDRRPEGHRATIERLDLQLDHDEWSLADSAWIDYGATGGYALHSLDLKAGDQAVVVDGTIGGDRALDVQVEADSLDIGTIADLVGLPGVQGWLGGRTRLGGTLDRPTGWTYLRGALHRVGAPPTPARIHLRSDGVRISGDLDLHSEGDGHLRLDGSARIPGVPAEADSSDTAPLDIRVASADLRLSALRPFVDARTVAELDGRLEADVTIGGSPSEPALDGTLQLQRGHIRLPALGTTWDDVVLTAHASGADLVVDSARAGSGSGSASLAGTISLVDPYPLDLSARLSSFQAIRTAPYHATVSGQLTASGSLGRPELEGDFSVESLDVYLGRRVADRNLETVELTAEDLSMLRDRFGYVPERAGRRARPLADRLTADLVVHLGRDSWLRNRSSPELSVPFTGDVEARLRPGEEPDLEGQVTTIAGRGFVEEFGRRFDLEEGTVTFDGPPRSARLDLSATYTIPARDDPNDAEATIVLTIRGTQESLDLELSSDPPMENSDIVSYIATGRPAAGALSFQGSQSDQGGLAEAGADLALGQLAGVIESAASQGVGLDVVEIRREGLREATLVAGKYVSPRVYVGFAQPVTLREGDGLSLGNQGESEVEVEIEALRWLLVNLEGSSSAFRLFLKGRYAY